jgi:hypothetical protein
MFHLLGNEYTFRGIDISDMQTAGVAYIWIPNIAYPEATSQEVTDVYTRILPNGEVQFMQHVVASFIQSSFSYVDYPDDIQKITIRFYEFSLNSVFVQLAGTASACCGDDYLVALFKDYNNALAIEQVTFTHKHVVQSNKLIRIQFGLSSEHP